MCPWVSKGLVDASQPVICAAAPLGDTHPRRVSPPLCVPARPTGCQAPEDSSLGEEAEGLETARRGCQL